MIWVLIPSGQRAKQCGEVVAAWRKLGFKVFISSWDDETTGACFEAGERDVFDNNIVINRVEMKSFAVLQNLMAKQVWWLEPNCSAVICGADDLWPVSSLEDIELAVQQNPDKVIWAKDGLYNAQATHPIVTRGWYEKHGSIFNEAYRHNFTDTDLMMRCAKEYSIVKMFDLSFDHRHWAKTKKMDAVYQIGNTSFRQDQFLFESNWHGTNVVHWIQGIERVKLRKGEALAVV